MSKRQIKKTLNAKSLELSILEKLHVSEIQKFYEPTSVISFKDYNRYSKSAWSYACQTIFGNYQIVTKELIQFLHYLMDQLNYNKAIEICAGHGTIAKELDIIATDRYLTEELSAFYNAINSKSVKYPNFVEKLTASEAVHKYKPDLVISSWATQKFVSKKKTPMGSVYGVDKHRLLKDVRHYIQISNENIHGNDLINGKMKYEIKADWLASRSLDQDLNSIYIFTDQEIDFDKFPENLEFDILT